MKKDNVGENVHRRRETLGSLLNPSFTQDTQPLLSMRSLYFPVVIGWSLRNLFRKKGYPCNSTRTFDGVGSMCVYVLIARGTAGNFHMRIPHSSECLQRDHRLSAHLIVHSVRYHHSY